LPISGALPDKVFASTIGINVLQTVSKNASKTTMIVVDKFRARLPCSLCRFGNKQADGGKDLRGNVDRGELEVVQGKQHPAQRRQHPGYTSRSVKLEFHGTVVVIDGRFWTKLFPVPVA